MGQAKQRGTFEQRAADARGRAKREQIEWEARRAVERQADRALELQRPAQRRHRGLTSIIAMAVIASSIGSVASSRD